MKYREIIPLKQRPNWSVTLPGSKSITNRVFLCAALAKGKSRIYGALKSDDTDAMLNALKKLGLKVKESKSVIEITGTSGKFKSGNVILDAGASGTTTRFLTALSILRKGKTTIKGTKRMKERPMKDLTNALNQITKFQAPNSKQAQNSKSKTQNLIKIKGDKSSQFLSALLMIAPMLDKLIRIEVVGKLVSKPYIDTTIAVMKAFGVKVGNDNYKSFEIKPQTYKSGTYTVEGDASAASYWTSIAYLHGRKVRFTNLTKKSIQGDINYETVLKPTKHEARGTRHVDMEAMPDVAMTLAVTAPFTKGQTKITGLSTLRIKETDRLKALETELNKVGVRVKTTKNSIAIESADGYPRFRDNVRIQTYDDHRMAMSFAVLGTKVPGIVIENPDCVDKTYPNFWKDLEFIYLSPIKLGQKNLVLTGMRASGKSYLGKKIAKHLGRKFIDIDLEVEKYAKMDIKGLVKKHNWEHFRKVEQKICSQYKKSKNLVIATGGGAILESKNMKNLMHNGINVFIFAAPSVLIGRMKKQSNRPALKGKDPLKELRGIWLERRDLYLKYADYIWDNTSGEAVVDNLKSIF